MHAKSTDLKGYTKLPGLFLLPHSSINAHPHNRKEQGESPATATWPGDGFPTHLILGLDFMWYQNIFICSDPLVSGVRAFMTYMKNK